jgi:hypothetical protein
MMQKTGSVLFIVLLTGAFIVCSGCTSPQSPPVPVTTPSPVATVVQTTLPAPPPETGTSLVYASAPTTSPAGTGTPANDVSIVLNSAVKKDSLGFGDSRPGKGFLEIELTISNNRKTPFEYSDSSFVLSFRSGRDSRSAVTSLYAKRLINPLISGTVNPQSTDTGNILFNVNESSNFYTLSVVDPAGTVLASINNIDAP